MMSKFDEFFEKPVCGLTDEAAIRTLEERLGVRLPAPYRQFLLKYNGGFVDPDAFIVYWEGDLEQDLPLLCFFGLCSEDHDYSMDSNLREYVGGSRIMGSLLPIGVDQTSNVVCLRIKGEKIGAVYAWIFEEEAEPEDVEAENETGWANMYLLAKDFDEFIEKIVVEPVEYE